MPDEKKLNIEMWFVSKGKKRYYFQQTIFPLSKTEEANVYHWKQISYLTKGKSYFHCLITDWLKSLWSKMCPKICGIQ